jgi:hypothetical protein
MNKIKPISRENRMCKGKMVLSLLFTSSFILLYYLQTIYLFVYLFYSIIFCIYMYIYIYIHRLINAVCNSLSHRRIYLGDIIDRSV